MKQWTNIRLVLSVHQSECWMIIGCDADVYLLNALPITTDRRTCVCVSFRRCSIVQFDTKQLKTFCFP